MSIVRVTTLAVAALAVAGPMPVTAQTYWEVENARANARAGGPTNAYDADLLERYGCLSGTRSRFCERLSNGGNVRHYYRARRVR